MFLIDLLQYFLTFVDIKNSDDKHKNLIQKIIEKKELYFFYNYFFDRTNIKCSSV